MFYLLYIERDVYKAVQGKKAPVMVPIHLNFIYIRSVTHSGSHCIFCKYIFPGANFSFQLKSKLLWILCQNLWLCSSIFAACQEDNCQHCFALYATWTFSSYFLSNRNRHWNLPLRQLRGCVSQWFIKEFFIRKCFSQNQTEIVLTKAVLTPGVVLIRLFWWLSCFQMFRNIQGFPPCWGKFNLYTGLSLLSSHCTGAHLK